MIFSTGNEIYFELKDPGHCKVFFMGNKHYEISKFRINLKFVLIKVSTYGLSYSALGLSQQILQLPMVAVHAILWHSHPPISNGIVFVWVGAAVSSTVSGDSVVYHLNSVAAITIGVNVRDVTKRCNNTVGFLLS